MIEIANPIRSEAKCAESVKIAIDPDKYPPAIYTNTKMIETTDARYKVLIAA